MPKTSKFPIDVLVIQLGFADDKTFGHCSEGEIQWQKVVFGPVQKAVFPFFCISKIKLHSQNVDWVFRSLGHKVLHSIKCQMKKFYQIDSFEVSETQSKSTTDIHFLHLWTKFIYEQKFNFEIKKSLDLCK